MRFWPFGRSQSLNTINLGDDLEDVEFVMAVEEMFGVQFADDETIKLITMADLEKLIRSKLEKVQEFDPVWTILCNIARQHTGHKGPIDRETTFLAKLAKERPTNG